MEKRSSSREARKSSSSSSKESRRFRSSNNFSLNSTKDAETSTSLRNFDSKINNNDHKTGTSIEDSSNNLPSLVGTCLHMCPDRERAQRERLRDLSMFERLNGNPGKTSQSLAVKKFCRTISTVHVQPSDMRPLSVLQNTLNYLLSLLDSSQYPFEAVYDFVFDRTRSIRQDLSMQNIVNDQAIHMYEEMVKFHIISHHKLLSCSGNPDISSVHYLNMEQLTKTLMSLYDLYDANRKFNSINENEAEFHSFYVLLHLGSNSQSTGESLSLWFRYLASPITKSKEMCFARKVLRFFRVGNYKCFLSTTAAEASYLQYCLLESFINEIRVQAVCCINNGGYKLHPYPLSHLSKLLMMKESDAESLCNTCGLETSTDGGGNKLLPTKQTGFCRPKGRLQNYSFLGLERLERQAAVEITK